MPRSPSQTLPPGVFTYLPRLVSTVPSSSVSGPPKPAEASCEEGQEGGEGRKKEGFPCWLRLSVILPRRGFWQRGGVCDYLPWAGLR